MSQATELEQVLAAISVLTGEVGALRDDVGGLRKVVNGLDCSVSELRGEVTWLKRSVVTLESAPAPYGRPKTFVTATEVHSVSHPTRVNLGYQG